MTLPPYMKKVRNLSQERLGWRYYPVVYYWAFRRYLWHWWESLSEE